MSVELKWRLRQVMAERGLWKTTDLHRRLDGYGERNGVREVRLSVSQVHRLVTQKPQRLNIAVLEALCSELACEPNDLLAPLAGGESREDPGR